MSEFCDNKIAETVQTQSAASSCNADFAAIFGQENFADQSREHMRKPVSQNILPALVVSSGLLAAAAEIERSAANSESSSAPMDWKRASDEIFKSQFDSFKPAAPAQKTPQGSDIKSPDKAVSEPHRPSPWDNDGKKSVEQRPEIPKAPEQKMKPLEKIAAAVPIYLDQKVRNGDIDLESLNGQEAAKVIAALPELFRLEGMRELSLLTAGDAGKQQVYVSQDLDGFRRQYPNLTVYGSIQQAVDHAPKGSVVNVLPGPGNQAYPKGRPYSEDVSIRRSDLVIKTNEKMPATIAGGGFAIGSGINDVKILNFNFTAFSGRPAAIRVEGESNNNIVIGGNYFYSATGSEAVGVYGTGKSEAAAISNVFLIGNVIGKDRQFNDGPLSLEGGRLEATPFNGNVKNIVAVGNLYFGTAETPLNLGLDFIGGESVSRGDFNQARDGFAAYNYGTYIGRGGYWSAGAGYIDGAARITQVLNMSEDSSLCGEIGAERSNTRARDNTFAGNICKNNSAHWIAIGAPSRNGASVSGSRVEKNIIIDQNREKNGENPREAHIQNNAGITRAELDSRNLFFDNDLSVTQLPRKLIELYQFYRKKP